jgi:hypothetical protein
MYFSHPSMLTVLPSALSLSKLSLESSVGCLLLLYYKWRTKILNFLITYLALHGQVNSQTSWDRRGSPVLFLWWRHLTTR